MKLKINQLSQFHSDENILRIFAKEEKINNRTIRLGNGTSTIKRLIKSILLPLTAICRLKNTYLTLYTHRWERRKNRLMMKMRQRTLYRKLSVISINVDILIKIISSKVLSPGRACVCLCIRALLINNILQLSACCCNISPTPLRLFTLYRELMHHYIHQSFLQYAFWINTFSIYLYLATAAATGKKN